MKKRFLVAAAVLAASVSFAQQKKQPPPPPAPPPVMDARVIPPLPPPPPSPVVPDKQGAGLPKDYRAFLKQNPTVKSIGWSENKVHIHLKSGKEEVYNLNDTEEMQKLQDKYGELPVAPPPPPPPPKASKIRNES